jgi:PAS domain S-box-containing protein
MNAGASQSGRQRGSYNRLPSRTGKERNLNTTIYILGIVLQAIAAVIALLQVRHAPRKLPWLLIALSSLLIVACRAAILGQVMEIGGTIATGEIITLIVSLLFFLGVVLMTRMFSGVWKDHVALKMSEAALRESEEQFRTLVQSAPDAIFIQVEERFAYVNDAAIWLYGATSEKELLGHDIVERIHPDHRAEILKRTRSVNTEEKPAPLMEQRHIKLNGTAIDVEAHSVPIRYQKCGGALVFVRDITERKRVEEALRESEQRFRRLFENSPVAYQSLDIEGRYIDVNQELCDLLGYSPDELLGRSFGELWPEKTRENFPHIFETLKCDREVSSELLLVAKDGREVSVILEGRTQYDTEDNFVRTHCILTDITERKRAEVLLQRQAELLRLSYDAIIVWQPEGVIESWNKGAEDLYGYSQEEAVGQVTHDLLKTIHPEPWPQLEAKLRELKFWEMELRHHTRDGQEVIVLSRHQLVRGADGVERVLEICRDITERKRAEEALRESEELLRIFIEHAPAALAMFDREMRYLSTSSRWLSDYHLGRRDLRGMSHYEVFPGLAERWKTFHRRALAGEVVRADRDQFERADGSVKWLRWEMRPWRDSTGDVAGIVIFDEDITERVQAEEHLRETIGRFKLATTSAKAGVWDWNLQTNEMIWDDRMFELYGLAREDFPVGVEAWEQGLHPDDSSRAIEECQAALNGKRDFDTEFRVQRPDGMVVDIKADGLVLRNEEGKPLRMIGLNIDITDRKRAEEERENLQAQLTQVHKMESVGRLAGGVAHDFNNMLGVILGHTEMAMDEVDSCQPLYADLQEIHKAAKRSADLTRQLLAFARQQTASPKVLNLNETMDGMLKMLKRLIGENIELAWLPDENLWPVKIDPSQLDQILANLSVNARDAIEGVGKLTIRTENAAFDETCRPTDSWFVPGDYVVLTLSDDGIGMVEETRNRIFEPFFTTKEVGKGTGLGLATVYGIVKQNNGYIDVHSDPGHGTTFKIHLPRHAGQTGEDLMPKALKIPKGRGETVLLVEDEPAILQMTKTMLQRMGYNVLAASTPGEAMRLAEENTGEIHLLITDVVMPEMNGRDLAARLLSLYPDLKSLFMSGYTADVIAHQGVLDVGVNFIQKPFSTKAMAEKVREVLGD